jgi:hypothetical protein
MMFPAQSRLAAKIAALRDRFIVNKSSHVAVKFAVAAIPSGA